MSKKVTTIYALVDPNTNQVRYVGKTTNRNPHYRLTQHLNWRLSPTNPKSQWIKNLEMQGKRPGFMILEQTTDEDWETIERKWIHYYRDRESPLLNVLDGGQKWTEEYRARKRRYNRARRNPLK